MLFSVSYKSAYKEEADEIKCPYNQLGLLWEFMKDHKDKRYNILVPNAAYYDVEKIIEQVDIIKSAGCDYTIGCGSLVPLETMLEKDYAAYWIAPVSDWETFNTLIDFGVSDIVVDGPLCFDIPTLQKGAGDRVILRTSPTHSANTAIIKPSANSFYIRPEDLAFYDQAIKILDFNTISQAMEDALFEIYKRRGSFNEYLDTLVPGLPHVLNSAITKEFAKTRMECRQRCKVPGYHCHYCINYLQLIGNTFDYSQDNATT